MVVDSRNPRDGKYIESLGYYNPLTEPAEVRIDEEKAISWLDKGAVPSYTILSLLRKAGILRKRHETQKRAALLNPLSAGEDTSETPESPEESPVQSDTSDKKEEEQAD